MSKTHISQRDTCGTQANSDVQTDLYATLLLWYEIMRGSDGEVISVFEMILSTPFSESSKHESERKTDMVVVLREWRR